MQWSTNPLTTQTPETVWTKVEELGVSIHSCEWRCARVETNVTPLILIAGLGASSRYLVPFARKLSERFQVLVPDFPGFGKTPPVEGWDWQYGPSVAEQADQLVRWMDARGIARAIVFGHSVGAQVAADVAMRFPSRVERLILAAPTYEASRRSVSRTLPRFLSAAVFEKPSLVALLVWEYLNTGPVRWARQAIKSLYDPIENRLPKIGAPTLILHGEYDPILSQRWVEHLASLLQDALLVTIRDAGHAMHSTAAEVTAETVRAFVENEFRTASREEHGVIATRDENAGKPVTPLMHGAIDYLASALMIIGPRITRSSKRTRDVMTCAGVGGLLYSAFTKYELGIIRKLPMVTHLNIDAVLGAGLLGAAATCLRHQRGRGWAIGFGLFAIVAGALTRIPTGPAQIVERR